MIDVVRVIIVYDSVSPSKVTACIAQMVHNVLIDKGIEVDSFSVSETDKAVLKDYDDFLVGAPTMGFRASPSIIQFLDGLSREGFSGKPAAAFDTQMQSRLSGSAAKEIEGKLKGLGCKLIAAPLVAYVEREGRETWRLREGEHEKVQKWAQGIAEALLK